MPSKAAIKNSLPFPLAPESEQPILSGNNGGAVTMVNSRALLVIAIIIAAAASRLLSHAPNLMPMDAVALFGGAYVANRRLAFVIPLASLLVSDAILGFYEFPQMASVYLGT